MTEEIIQQIKKGALLPELLEESMQILKQNIKEDEPFFIHSLRTSLILKEMNADDKTTAGGILHHVPRTNLSFKDTPEETKKEIATLLKKIVLLRELCSSQNALKPKLIKQWHKVFLDQQAENLRRMFFAVSQDIRPIFIMLAGKLDEMLNLAVYYPQQQRLEQAVLTLEILAPLAYSVGMTELKGKIEDAAFPYVYPKEYKWLVENLKEPYEERRLNAEEIKLFLLKILKEEGIETSDIHARAKHYFSLYQKLLRYNMDIDKIYDLVALRILVPDIESCYQTLGMIHKHCTPIQGRMKDYISLPKANGYRSLHTTIFCEEGKIVEVQIRTQEMHKEAEHGAVAHFGYKEKINPVWYKHQFYWMDKLRKWQEEIKDPQKISDYLRSELFKNQIFILTPKKEIINLPKGSTPVDFAYAVHSGVGEHCQGAKINGKIASLDRALKNGETVEIITDKNKTPSAKWLRFVKTSKARSEIKNFLQKAYGFYPEKQKTKSLKEKISSIKNILPLKKEKEMKVIVAGESGISMKLSRCCLAKPGNEISAFITQGEGASIHKNDCPNLIILKEKWPQKIVQATWGQR